MFKHIMVPVDMAHPDKLEDALRVAAELARHYDARVTYVGVTSNQPGPVARTPEEFREKLGRLAAAQAEAHGLAEATGHAVYSHDPAVDLDHALAETVSEIGADLVVMGSHIPHRFDFGSHGGRVATHTSASVMLVRS